MLRSAAIVVGRTAAVFTFEASASVPIFTGQRSVPHCPNAVPLNHVDTTTTARRRTTRPNKLSSE